MFCPNCGTQNPDAAQTCSKCNFHLKSVAAPKFKGTMLMMNQPGAVPVAPPPQGQPNTQRTGLQGSTPPPPGAAGVPAPNRLKGTMVGVAPMANPGRPMNAPVAVPSAGGPPMGGPPMGGPMGGAPMAPTIGVGAPPMGGPMGGPIPQGPRTPPPPGGQDLSFSPPVPQPGVNPLGGTVAADGSAFNPYGGPPPGGMQYGAPPAQGTALMPGVGAQPYAQYGGPPPQGPPGHSPSGPPQYDAGGMGGMPPSPYGAPPPNPFAGPPPGYTPQPPPGGMGMGGAPMMGGPGPGQPQGMMIPYGHGQGGAAPLLPGGLASLNPNAPTTGPTRRNALMTLLIPFGIMVAGNILAQILVRIVPALAIIGNLVQLAGSVLMAIWLYQMIREVKTVTRNESLVPWHIFIPIYGAYVLWILVPQEVAKAKQLLGVQQPTRSIVLYIFLSPFALASDVNDMVR